MHGAGGRNASPELALSNQFFAKSGESTSKQFVCFAPTCSANTWFDLFEHLKALVYTVASLPFTDTSRIYGAGTSMGDTPSGNLP